MFMKFIVDGDKGMSPASRVPGESLMTIDFDRSVVRGSELYCF